MMSYGKYLRISSASELAVSLKEIEDQAAENFSIAHAAEANTFFTVIYFRGVQECFAF